MIVMQEKEMRKESLWLIGFVILCCLMIIGLSSCSNYYAGRKDSALKMTYQNIRQFERAHHIPAIAPAIQQKLNELWKSKE